MDPRTASTKASIKRSFIELAKETGIDGVSVSALCKKVGIPRQTFYYHYSNWQQLIDEILDDEVALYSEAFKTNGSDSLEAIRLQLEAMESHREFHIRLEEAGYDSLLIKKMIACAYDAFIDKWRDYVGPERAKEAEMNFAFAIAGFYHIVLDKDNKFERDEVIEFVAKYLRFQKHNLEERVV